METKNVKLRGMRGTWYVIDSYCVTGGTMFYLWENEQCGEAYPAVLTDGDLTVYDDCCWSGIREALLVNIWHL